MLGAVGSVWGDPRGACTGVERTNIGVDTKYTMGNVPVVRALCSEPGCAPIEHHSGRTMRQQFYVHFARSAGHVVSLRGPKQAPFRGYPGVPAVAISREGICGASVMSWSASYSGRRTVVQVARGCSVGHQRRGGHTPNHS